MFNKLEYSRYSNLKGNFPLVLIDERVTDKKERWVSGSKMNILSSKYYGDPRYGFIIMMANPSISMEFDIEVNTIIRIPLPFKDVLKEVIEKIENK